MAILLPLQTFDIGPGIGKSYFEDLRGGTNATVTVNNDGAAPIDLVLFPVNSPVLTYTIPAGTSLTIGVGLLLVAALLTGPAAGTFGTIQIVASDF
ncbi:hypothetical protein [Paenibacillus physcomitrellae]|uniref:DUF1573 domain-containing protein n=1 Tax=Paenibacillus physcomitrellae TaxID=1619311 RepID=A0ABQ1GQA3_9BACL|nr:hypothetical protein [Paenibacillus physcomitrellae]GGA47954.1 hypothetical protein GCM10010917_36580 [Paenibacillus physcomitrellae]